MTIAVVTDSSAALPGDIAERHHVHVVPLAVVVDGRSYAEGVDITPEEVSRALRAGTPVRTSRPGPASFDELYRSLADRGVTGAVALHLSSRISGTYDAACAAAERAPIRVQVVDGRSVGMALGFAALAGERAAADGADLADVAAVARASVDASRTFFYVDDLTHLRRGGRIGKATAAVGTALAIKPLLRIDDGAVEAFEKVRTGGRALARMVDHAVAAAERIDGPVEISVQHLDARERAERLLEKVTERVDDARQAWLVELGAALGAHVGPGSLGVSVSPRR